MAKRGYRGKHPNDDMKVAPTSHTAANKHKLTAEYNRTDAKNKYDYIKTHDGFYPQGVATIVFNTTAATPFDGITLTSVDGFTKLYDAAEDTGQVLLDPATWTKTGGSSGNIKKASFIAAVNAPNIDAVAASATVTFTTIADIDEGDTVTLKDSNGSDNVFVFSLLDDIITDNKVGIQAANTNGNNATDAAVQFCASANNSSSTTKYNIKCTNEAHIVTLTSIIKGIVGNQTNGGDNLTGDSTLTNFIDGVDKIVPGHDGRIIASDGGDGTVILTQAEPGPDGNLSFTPEVGAQTTPSATLTSFTGG